MKSALVDASQLELPSPPQTLAAIVQAASDPETSPAKLSELVSIDPGFSTKILAVANSSFYRRGAPVTAVAHAVGMLGSRQLQNVALCAAAQASVDKKRLGDFHLTRFWENSLRRAVAARVLAQHVGEVDPMSAFTAGLLQDLGVLALIQTWPDRSKAWMGSEREWPDDRLQHERELFGIGHDEVADAIAKRWGLPEELKAAMAGHHGGTCTPEHAELCALSNHAELIATVLATEDKRSGLERLRLTLAQDRGMSRPEVDALLAKTSEQVVEMASVLGVKVKSQPTLESIQKAAFAGLAQLNFSYEQLLQHLESSLAIQDRLTNELQQRNAELEHLASTDMLTELPNRRVFWSTLSHHVEQAGPSDIVGMLLIDADRFKSINDTHGHEVGDIVLRHLAKVTRDTVSSDELVARIGGEEFAVVYVARDREYGAKLGQRIVDTVKERPCSTSNLSQALSVTVSIGLATTGTTTKASSSVEIARALYRAADAALYQAKNKGRCRLVCTDTSNDPNSRSGWLSRWRARVA